MNLLDEISDFDDLHRSWRSIPKKTSGEDSISVEQFKSDVVGHLKRMRTELKNKTYKFSAIHERKIKKKNSNKTRTINLYTLKDKIVQRSIQKAFQKKRKILKSQCLFPEMVNDVSIAYIPKTLRSKDISGVVGSTNLVAKYINENFPVLTTMDIESFFDRIDIEQLKNIISQHLNGDTSIDWLLEQFYDPEVIKLDYDDSDFTVTSTGLKQGSILAPLFSNIFLMDFDQKLIASGIKAIRYADDLAIFSVDETQAKDQIKLVESLLQETAGIGFYKDGSKKPKILNIKRHHSVEFLGIRYSFEGGILRKYPVESKVTDLKNKITDTSNRNDLSFVEIVTKLNTSIQSWRIFYEENLKCHKGTINRMNKEITQLYYEQMDALLRKKGITQIPLTKKKLKYLGITIT